MQATRTGGYRCTLGLWDAPDVSATLPKDRWDKGNIVVALPEVTVKDEPYIVSVVIRTPKQARALARQLNKAAAILDPPKKRGT